MSQLQVVDTKRDPGPEMDPSLPSVRSGLGRREDAT